MPKLPQVSGDDVVALLLSLGYSVQRQRGSHMQLARSTGSGEHRVTVPAHRVVAKGTLNDILTRVSAVTGVTKDELVRRLR